VHSLSRRLLFSLFVPLVVFLGMTMVVLDASFREVPVLAFPSIPPGAPALLETAARLSGNALLIGLQLAAPVLIALFLVDIAFGMLNRVASQINVHQESQPVKAMAGLGVLLLASGLLMSRMVGILGDMMNSVTAMLHALRP